MATAGLTLGVSHLSAAAISPIPDSQVNGSAQLVNGAIQLTNGSGNETGSAFYKTKVSTKKVFHPFYGATEQRTGGWIYLLFAE